MSGGDDPLSRLRDPSIPTIGKKQYTYKLLGYSVDYDVAPHEAEKGARFLLAHGKVEFALWLILSIEYDAQRKRNEELEERLANMEARLAALEGAGDSPL